ncbi:TonB-dependent receptor domain-containing protein [Sphingorhabdus arenilitoris]|uniref:TonB-dependent receptor domain-containing protein n=1 Tax=Sphingorhabdus arenilitoris TaxID=1490041 RepID=A0ABV8RJ73_9SPHN
MLKLSGFKSLLLLSTAIAFPSLSLAQEAPQADEPAAEADADASAEQPQDTASDDAQDQVDVSVPGGGFESEIIVRGRRTNPVRDTPQVVSVLSSEDIERTGEGDIAGALGRVTGLSVVGNGFVYVRGLGDRYSLALLNGSPLPSPEPLKRVVPLDLFPTSVIASSLVQKSYSANFPGEFGGGVINLTTKAIPEETFVTFGGGIGWDTESTNELGYTYFGSSSDWTGFDNGNRDLAPALSAFLASGERISLGSVDTQAIAGELVRGRDVIVQSVPNQAPNFSGSLSTGTAIDIGDTRLGIIATAGYSNKLRTRDTLQQTAADTELSQTELDFRRVITDNRIVVNGLLGFGLEFGDNKLRWTNVYIRDTLKQARIGIGTRETTSPTATLQQQDTAWFERQLINTQLVAELRPIDDVKLDVRASYANSQREAPNEFSFEYFRSNSPTDPFGEFFINRLNNGQEGSASVSFSDLNEDLYSAGVDLSYRFAPTITGTVGYAYADTSRRTERRDFLFTAPSSLPTGVALLRPDLLLQPSVIDAFGIALIDTNEANPVFDAALRNHGAYAQLQADVTDDLSVNVGVRYETAKQSVTPVQVFNVPTASLAGTNLNNDYWLPAATITYKVGDDFQFRLNASKTIARPQFRELIFQTYFDPDSNRQFRGNPLLTDSELFNVEGRAEYYLGRDERVSLTGFFKRIDNPIETFASFSDNTVISSFANAPRANLYGAELETQKYFNFDSESPFWDNRRIVVIGNYTYTKSNISVNADDPVAVFASASTSASDFFRDGEPLTGQSDHLVNIQLGLEDTDKLSQQTLLFSYASNRVTARGASLQPDIFEKPGIQLDFVMRQGIKIAGAEAELKFEARNLTGTKYQELQQNGDNQIFYNLYNVGRTFSASLSITF